VQGCLAAAVMKFKCSLIGLSLVMGNFWRNRSDETSCNTTGLSQVVGLQKLAIGDEESQRCGEPATVEERE